MNEQNLIPNSKRTREQLQEMGRKGGFKSGETRRRNKEQKKKIIIIANEIVRSVSRKTFDEILRTFVLEEGGKNEE